MIRHTQTFGVNLHGDGESISAEVDLTPYLSPGQEVEEVTYVQCRGPVPWPECKGEVVKGKKNQLVLVFSSPLINYVGNNGYTFFITVRCK